MALAVNLHSAAQSDSKVVPIALTSVGGDLEALSVADMGKVFERSHEVHVHAMDDISRKMSVPRAVEALKQGTFAGNPDLKDIASLIAGGQLSKSALRAKQPSGYSGID